MDMKLKCKSLSEKRFMYFFDLTEKISDYESVITVDFSIDY